MGTLVKGLIPVFILTVGLSHPLVAGQGQTTPPPPPGDTQAQPPPPSPFTPTFSGGDLYRTYCASCHGKSAKGDGPLAEYMKRRPPDLTLLANRNGGTYDRELVGRMIDGRNPVPGHGGHDMPVWGDAFKLTRDGSTEESVKARVDALVEYVESLQEKSAPATPPPAPPATPPAGQ